MIENKEQLKEAIRLNIAMGVAEIILEKYPTASTLYYSPHVEYNDQDDDYWASKISIYDEDQKPLYDIYEADYDNGEYRELCNFGESIEEVIDNQDFAFAYGFQGVVDLKPYK